MRLWLLALVGCYAPSVAPGAPCADNGACPSGLVCTRGTCELTEVDAALPPDDTLVPLDGVATATCWAAWHSGAPVLSVPAVVAELRTGADEGDPTLDGSDGLELFFTRIANNQPALYRATRPSRALPFGAAIAVAELDGGNQVTRLSTTANGLSAVVSIAPASSADLYATARPAIGTPFATPTTAGLSPTIDTSQPQYDPQLSADGLVLYYADTLFGNLQRIRRSERPSLAADFESPTLVAFDGVSNNAKLADPQVSPDELSLIFSMNQDLYVATRASPADAFAAPVALSINTPAFEGDSGLSRDGCELLFTSNRGSTSRDIYRTLVTPQ